jgi:geranylgeranyl reductase family protein
VSRDAEVIVVGGGPGGATAARELARRGVETLLVERSRLPRYKSCAGGIPVRAARALDFPIDSVIEDTITGLHLSYRGRNGFTRYADSPIAYMVMRDRFDALLVERAREAGARVRDGVSVRAVQREGAGFRVETDGGDLRCSYVLGADGANSVVARGCGLGRGLAECVALEAEVCAPDLARARWRGLINLDLGYPPWGYAWVFPKTEWLSVGVALPRSRGPDIRRQLFQYLERLGLAEAPVDRLVGHKVLFRRERTPIAGEGVALVGDAAGLADEFSAEGIYYAIRSGRLAAVHVARATVEGRRWLGAYERSVDRGLMPELRAARLVARLFYAGVRRAPWLTFRVLRRVNHLCRALFRVLRGDSSYDRELPSWMLPPAITGLLLRTQAS